MSLDLVFNARSNRQAMNIDPLLESFLHVVRIDDGVGAAMPDGELWPWSTVWRRGTDQVTPFSGGAVASPRHGLERILEVDRTAVGQARDNGSSSEHVGIGRE